MIRQPYIHCHRIKLLTNKKNLLLILTLAITLVGIISSCSDDTPTTGTICIEFSSWEREWNKQVTFTVAPIEKQDCIIKTVKLDIFKKNYIELNPGNYMIDCYVTGGDHNKDFLHEPVQIQAGKTETYTLGK